MEKYLLFMESAVRLISQGQFFRKVFSIILRVLAVCIALVALITWIPEWKSLSGASNDAMVGIIIFQLLFVVATYMVVHVIIIRASDIAALPEADYTVIPIVSISLKLLGEIYACFTAVISLAGGILIWFVRGDALFIIKRLAPLVPTFGGAQGFLDGLLFIIIGWFVAFLVLVVFYFLAEKVVVLVDIAKNTKITSQVAEQYKKK